jgi:transposase-like protein
MPILSRHKLPANRHLQFQRQLGWSGYERAFQLLHKLRAGMVRPERDTIGSQYPVEVDEAFVGGRTKGQGRGVDHMATVIGAIEIGQKAVKENGQFPKSKSYAGRLRLRVISNRESKTLTAFVRDSVANGATVRTDGWRGYRGLGDDGVRARTIASQRRSRKNRSSPADDSHCLLEYLKPWLLGTHHGVSHQHLQAYLNEFVFRFNRRFYPMTAFNSALGLVANATAPTYEMLYSGQWTHPKT